MKSIRSILFLLLMLLINTTYGQSRKTDAVKEIEQLLELSSKNAQSNSDSAIIYANTAIIYSKDRQKTKYIVKSYKTLGKAYSIAQKQEKAREAYLKAMDYAKQAKDNHEIALIEYLIGHAFRAESDFKSAINHYKITNKYAHENNDTSLLAKTSLDIGVIHARKGSYYTAIEYFFKSIEYFETTGETKYTLPLLNNIGSIYTDIDEYEKGLVYLEKAKNKIEIDSKEANTYLIYVTSNIGRCHINLNQYDQAIESYKIALSAVQKNEDEGLKGKIYNQLGAAYLELNELDQAIEFYEKASSILDEENYPEAFSATLRGLAKINNKKGNYSQALKYIEASSRINISIDNLDDITRDYRILSSIHNKLGNKQKAYDYLQQHIELKDSVFNINKNAEITLLESKYNYKQEELSLKTEVENLKKDKALQKSNQMILILVLFAISIGSLMLFGVFNKKKKENYLLKKDLENKAIIEEQAKELSKMNEMLELKVIERTAALQVANKNLEQANYELRTFNYIASHDIKEPIRNIGNYVGLIFKKIPSDLKVNLVDYFDIIKRSTSQLYTLIEDFARYTTLSKDEKIAKQEIDLNYLSLGIIDNLQESIQKYDGQVLISELPTIQSSNFLLSTTLKNLIQNGLQYNKSEKPTVKVKYNATKTDHEIIVTDNGIGIDEKYHEKIFEMFKRLHHREAYEGSGIGLSIVKLSVEKLGGSIELESQIGKGSRFVVKLPK